LGTESLTSIMSRYMAGAAQRDLPDEVLHAARIHTIDTFAAIISGSALAPGICGATVARTFGGCDEAMVIGSNLVTGAASAALANGMSAHADETDDSHALSLSHPGCAIVPAALAVAERNGRSGLALLKAVVAGYDVGTRVGLALGRPAVDLRFSRPSSHSIVGTFGAAVASAVLEDLNELQCEYVLSYAAQRAAGVTTWQRDVDHIEKAYVFAGAPAQTGVMTAMMVALGCTGVLGVFDNNPNFLDAFSQDPNPSELISGLGTRFEIVATNIKRYSVGSPAQAAVQATEEILRDAPIDLAAITSIEIRLPADLAGVVNDRAMPDVNVQYLVAGTLLDGECSFAMSHDYSRMNSDEILRLRRLMTLVPDESRAGTRSAELTIHLHEASPRSKVVDHVRGTAENPMTMAEVRAKAIDVITPVVGKNQARTLVAALEKIDELTDVRELREVLWRISSSDQVPS
jgi:2-methylcitrate dehydratase PrpD